jgi:hypothetical protein
MDEAERMAERFGREVRYCGVSVAKAGVGQGGEATVIPAFRTLRNVAQQVRNGAMDEILSGSPSAGLGWQNVYPGGRPGYLHRPGRPDQDGTLNSGARPASFGETQGVRST